jgi:peptidoglycan/xylan/chitin deacetylase (PgdA/CDA1 family)
MRWGVAALVVAAAAGGAWVTVATGKPPSIRVEVESRMVAVPAGTTLAHLRVRPTPGDLLDVDGNVLRRDAFPGELLVNGRPARGDRVLRAGDRVRVRNGRDRTEPVTRRVTTAAVRRRSSPQFYVELLPGRSVETRGALSHRLVSTRFVADGAPVMDDAVALTFDDGPSPYTPRILAILGRLHVPATFFVVGSQAEEYPGLVRVEAAAGMALGDHTYSHPWRTPFAQLPDERIAAEIDRGQAALRRLGVRSVLFRPPGGSYSPYVLREAAARGMRVVLWSVDARDWVAGTTADEIVRRVLASVRAGSIVVMHDGGGNREATVEALPAIVAGIRRAGWRFVTFAPVG